MKMRKCTSDRPPRHGRTRHTTDRPVSAPAVLAYTGPFAGNTQGALALVLADRGPATVHALVDLLAVRAHGRALAVGAQLAPPLVHAYRGPHALWKEREVGGC